MSESKNEKGETMVFSNPYFTPNSRQSWSYAFVVFRFAMLVIATMQTFQTRSIRQEINETQTLATMIYSHFMFVCIRLVAMVLDAKLSHATKIRVRSIIYSLDCVATILIYFVPKFVAARREDSDSISGSRIYHPTEARVVTSEDSRDALESQARLSNNFASWPPLPQHNTSDNFKRRQNKELLLLTGALSRRDVTLLHLMT